MFIRKLLYIPVGMVLLILAFAGLKVQTNASPVMGYYFNITSVRLLACNEDYGVLVWDARYNVPAGTTVSHWAQVSVAPNTLNIYPNNQGYLDHTKTTITGYYYWTFPNGLGNYYDYNFWAVFQPRSKLVINGTDVVIFQGKQWNILARCSNTSSMFTFF